MAAEMPDRKALDDAWRLLERVMDRCDALDMENGRLRMALAEIAALKAESERLRDIAGRLVEVVHELAKLGRCPIILRALAMDARAALTQERA